MNKQQKQKFYLAAGFLAAFVLWTAAVCLIDVQAIGPQGSSVGLAAVNRWFHERTGVHMSLYTITDRLGLVPLGFVAGFALLGLIRWIGCKALRKVDFSLLVLGGFYLAVLAGFVLFELFPVNYRPVLIDGVLEESYPSSTTMLVMCVIPTAVLQLQGRIKNRTLRRGVILLSAAFLVFMVLGRLLSGVHWLSDIIGGGLLSAGLVMLYVSICALEKTA